MTTTLVLVLLSWLALSYLIYRYARYSPWRSQPIGRAFMMMKTALWATLAYVLAARLLPMQWSGRRVLMTFLLMYLLAAIIAEISEIVKLQGGWRRRKSVDEHAGV